MCDIRRSKYWTTLHIPWLPPELLALKSHIQYMTHIRPKLLILMLWCFQQIQELPVHFPLLVGGDGIFGFALLGQ